MDSEKTLKISLNRSPISGFGFNIKGGIDNPISRHDEGIFVSKIRAESPAAENGKLSCGDKILKMNNETLGRLTHEEAVQKFTQAGDTLELEVVKNALTVEDVNDEIGWGTVVTIGVATICVVAAVGIAFLSAFRRYRR